MDGEKTYFSCDASGGHALVCGQSVDNNLILTYRYDDGREVAVYHRWDERLGPRGKFTKNSYHRYGVQYSEIGIPLEEKAYRVFSYYTVDGGTETFSRGVRVQDRASGDEIDLIVCTSTLVDDIRQLLPNLDCDPDSALGCAN